MDSETIRERFQRFFEEKAHQRLPSAPLILREDPSVFFTSAGMQPLVPYFLGKKQPPAKRIVTVQKCFRTTDLEEVGDSYHQTFFEMLGNFAIGDYWKREAIEWGWELLVKTFGFDPATLVATVYSEDDEAYDLWTKTLGLLPAEKVYRLGDLARGDDTNFWSPGPTGLCGPCSEVFVDRGPQLGVATHDCSPAENCGRWLEIWNFVFQQYDRREDGTLVPLAKRNIDTGTGLERLAQVLQGVTDTYRTDLFAPLVKKIESLSGATYGADPERDRAIRIVAEHSRAAAFLIADGIAPSNEWRGYVLRRLIRRGALYARRLGLRSGALALVSGEVVKTMQRHHHELTGARDRIAETIGGEEEKFERTLAAGLEILNVEIAETTARGSSVLPGTTAFKLYDTYGFPLDMTKEIATAAALTVDVKGFDQLLEEQRHRGRATAKFSQDAMRFGQLYADLREKTGLQSEFIGHEQLHGEGVVRSLVVAGEGVTLAAAGAEIEIVLDRTPFYPEGGGQVGDRGEITTPEGRAMVADTQTAAPGVIVMSAKVIDGVIRVAALAHAQVDEQCRRDTMRNHTGTHLLHAALRGVLGDEVHQAGSLVHAPNLRFDFSFGRGLTAEELHRVEDDVNIAILANATVRSSTMPLQEALATGAMALFDEKYADVVRVVEAGPSRELCGGTHCHCTGDIGLFLIVKEESIGAGVRRIEALTGHGALREVREVRDRLARAAAGLKVPPARVPEAVTQLQETRERIQQELVTLERQGVESRAREMVAAAETVGTTRLVVADAGKADVAHLRALADRVRDLLGSGVTVLGGIRDGKPSLVVTASKDLASLDADAIVKAVASLMDGKGGGRKDSASAGGKDPARLTDTIAAAGRAVRERLNGSGG